MPLKSWKKTKQFQSMTKRRAKCQISPSRWVVSQNLLLTLIQRMRSFSRCMIKGMKLQSTCALFLISWRLLGMQRPHLEQPRKLCVTTHLTIGLSTVAYPTSCRASRRQQQRTKLNSPKHPDRLRCLIKQTTRAFQVPKAKKFRAQSSRSIQSPRVRLRQWKSK